MACNSSPKLFVNLGVRIPSTNNGMSELASPSVLPSIGITRPGPDSSWFCNQAASRTRLPTSVLLISSVLLQRNSRLEAMDEVKAPSHSSDSPRHLEICPAINRVVSAKDSKFVHHRQNVVPLR